jgi:hypothetical protein
MSQRELGLPAPDGGAITYLQARTVNEALKAQERRMRLQQRRGELASIAPARWRWCFAWPARSAMPGSAGRRASPRRWRRTWA